jgi:hypothetical protein
VLTERLHARHDKRRRCGVGRLQCRAPRRCQVREPRGEGMERPRYRHKSRPCPARSGVSPAASTGWGSAGTACSSLRPACCDASTARAQPLLQPIRELIRRVVRTHVLGAPSSLSRGAQGGCRAATRARASRAPWRRSDPHCEPRRLLNTCTAHHDLGVPTMAVGFWERQGMRPRERRSSVSLTRGLV